MQSPGVRAQGQVPAFPCTPRFPQRVTAVTGLGGAPAGSREEHLGGGVTRTWSCMGGRDTEPGRSGAGWYPALRPKTRPYHSQCHLHHLQLHAALGTRVQAPSSAG